MRLKGFERYLAAGDTGASLALTAGRKAFADLGANTSTDRVLDVGSIGMDGVDLQFFGAGSNDQAGTYKVWGVLRGDGGGSPASGAQAGQIDWDLFLLGSGAWTLASGIAIPTGATAPVKKATELMADTVTWTAAAHATGIAAASGLTPTVISPADDATAALLRIPYVGEGVDILIEIAKGTATNGNCLVRRTRV